MKFTNIGSDYITISESNLYNAPLHIIPKIHIIKLEFEEPTRKKIEDAILLFPKTNRYVIRNNIKIYNNVLRSTSKKYYVENTIESNFITFMRKNNKILLNINNLNSHDKSFILDTITLEDVLRNVEVIQLSQKYFNKFKPVFFNWNGNIIIE